VSRYLRMLGRFPWAERILAVPGDGGRELTRGAVDVFRQFVQADGDLEAGGILLGRYLNGEGVVVDDATVPASGDLREPRAFHRLDEAHTDRAMEAWRESDGRVHYVGEWHTHSEDDPVPSALDIASWCDCHDNARRQTGGDAPTLWVIVGRSTIGVWEVA
jgi:integrative and conjugative element protein (TIGR02256 family)